MPYFPPPANNPANNEVGAPTAVVASPVGNTGSAGTAGLEFANPDHVHAHGSQTNPAHHAVATTTANGFMSSTDKTKLNGIETAATADAASAVAPPAIASTGSAGTDTNTYANANHTHAGVASVSVNGGAAQQGAVSVTVPTAANAAPPSVAATSSTGTTTGEYALEDHPHAGVTSFNGRQGAVTPQQADYDAFFTTPAEASAAAPVQSIVAGTGITVSGATGNVTVNNAGVTSVNGQTGAVTLPSPLSAARTAANVNSATVADNDIVTLTIPAARLAAGASFSFECLAAETNGTTASTSNVYLKVNGTRVATSGVANGTTAQTNRPIYIEGKITFKAVGAAGSYIGTVEAGFTAAAAVAAATNIAGTAINTDATVTIAVGVALAAVVAGASTTAVAGYITQEV